MKKITMVMMALLLASGSAWATDNIAVFGSYWNTKDLDWGGGGGLKLGIPLGSPDRTPVALEFRGAYYRDLSKGRFDDQAGFNLKIRDIPVEAGLRLDLAPRAPLNLYLGAGGSYHFLDSNVGNLSNEVGYYGLIGLEVGHAKSTNFFAEGMYRKIKGTVEDVPNAFELSGKAALQLKGFAANAGLAWRF